MKESKTNISSIPFNTADITEIHIKRLQNGFLVVYETEDTDYNYAYSSLRVLQRELRNTLGGE